MDTGNNTSPASQQAFVETTDAPPQYSDVPEAVPSIRADTVNATGIMQPEI